MLHLWLNLLHGRIQQDSSLNPIYSCVQHIAVQVVNIHHCSSQKCTLCRICWINVFLHTFVDGSSKKLYSTSYCGFPRSWEWDGHELTSTLTFDTQHWIAFSHRSETGTSVRSTCSIHSIIPTVILSTGEHTRFVRDSGLCTLTSAPFSYTERHRIGGSDGTETKTGTMGVIESARTLSG